MAMYDFECKKCEKEFCELTPHDPSGKYAGVVCPHCGSKKKRKIPSSSNYSFSNPVGTDRWNSAATGHDYRFKHNIPKVKAERKVAEALSHMGSNPYGSTVEADINRGEGIHTPETRPGMS